MSQLSLLAGTGVVPDPPAGSSDEWYTPRWYFDPLHAENKFTLDVCATAESAKVPRYFDYLADGLVQSWKGERWWANVPYSNIQPWVAKAWEEMKDAPFGQMLLPAWTDRAWWQAEVEPFRDRDFTWARRVRSKSGGWDQPSARPWASLTCEFGPRIRFGFPGDPDGTSPKALADGAKIYPVLLTWRAR